MISNFTPTLQTASSLTRADRPASGADPAQRHSAAASTAGDTTLSTPEPQASPTLVIPGGTGSQGAALAFAASRTRGSTHQRNIVIPFRDDGGRGAPAHVAVEHDRKRYPLATLPGVRFVDSKTISSLDARNMLVVTTVPRGALAEVLRSLPQPMPTVVATYNGVPPPLPAGISEPEHVVSVFPSFSAPEQSHVFRFGPGQLVVGARSQVAQDLRSIFGTTFTVTTTPDPLAAQWSKIATNTAVNSLATILGIKVMDLRKLIDSDVRVASLLKGVVAEVCRVAQREGVKVEFDSFHAGVLSKIPPTMNHFTSTGETFRAGKSLSVDLHSFTLGVSTTAQRPQAGSPVVDTPLCNRLTTALRNLETMRGKDTPLPDGFYARPEVLAIQATLFEPVVALHSEAAVGVAQGAPLRAAL